MKNDVLSRIRVVVTRASVFGANVTRRGKAPANATNQQDRLNMDQLRISSRLVKRREAEKERDQEEIPQIIQVEDTENKPPNAKAARNRKYRQKIKLDPDRYKNYRKKENERHKTARKNWTEEQVTVKRAQTRQRVQKWREKQKSQGLPIQKKKPQTRKQVEEEREKNRLRQQKYRASLKDRPQKRGWKTKKNKRAEQVAHSTEQANAAAPDQSPAFDIPLQNETPASTSTRKGFSRSSGSRIVKKTRNTMPDDPERYAFVLQSLINSCSPRKRLALQQSDILPCARKELFATQVGEQVQSKFEELKASKKGEDRAKRFVLGKVILNAGKGKSASKIRKGCGLNFFFAKKCLTGHATRKRRKDALSLTTKKLVEDFYCRGDVSRCDPSAAAVSTKTHEPRRYMEKTLSEAHAQFQDEAKVQISFSSFAKLRPKSIKLVSQTKINNCCCEYCINIQLKKEAINKVLLGKGCNQLPGKHQLLAMTLCRKENGHYSRSCIDRVCTDCGVSGIGEHLNTALAQYADTEVEWGKWILQQQSMKGITGEDKVSTKRKLVRKVGTLKAAVTELEEELVSYSAHITNAEWQHSMFSTLQKDLPEDSVLFCMDFAENYHCMYQDEAQGAHWTRQQVTIHPVIAYYRCPDDGQVITESLVFISPDLKHDNHAVHHFASMAVKDLKQRGVKMTKVIHFSDGCAGQYKGRTSFVDASLGTEDSGMQVEKHFFGSRHGKGPCDAEIGVIKRVAMAAVKARRAVISDASELYSYCEKRLSRPAKPQEHSHSRRKFFFVDSIDHERAERAGPSIKTVPGTRNLHCIRGVSPFVIATRHLSCFCSPCLEKNGTCVNEAFCGPWSEDVHLLKGHRQARKRKTASKRGKKDLSDDPQPGNDSHLQPSDDPQPGDDSHLQPSGDPQPGDDSHLQPDDDLQARDDPHLQPGDDPHPQPGDDGSTSTQADAKSLNPTAEESSCQGPQKLAQPVVPRVIFFRRLQSSMKQCTSYAELENVVRENLDKMEEYPLPPIIQRTVVGTKTTVDKIALALKPPSVEAGLYPVVTSGDGNCFFRALSVFAYGKESSHFEMRCRVVVELVINKRKYTSGAGMVKDQEDPHRFLALLTVLSDACSLEVDKVTPDDIEDGLASEILAIRTPSSFCGLWQVAAAANVLGAPVCSVYPHKGWYFDLNNRTFLPDFPCPDAPICHIMWSSNRENLPEENWTSNHFVPLMPLTETSTVELAGSCTVYNSFQPHEVSLDDYYTVTWEGEEFVCSLEYMCKDHVQLKFMSIIEEGLYFLDSSPETSYENVGVLKERVVLDLAPEYSSHRRLVYRRL